jgi:hypothetical protein
MDGTRRSSAAEGEGEGDRARLASSWVGETSAGGALASSLCLVCIDGCSLRPIFSKIQ